MPCRPVFMLIAMLALGCAQERRPLLEKTRLKNHPVVYGGLEIDSRSILLTLDTDGTVFQDGEPTALEDVAAMKATDDPKRSTPIVIEVGPEYSVGRCTPLLSALMKSKIRNVSFLVSTSLGPRAVPLPVEVQHRWLSTVVGEVVYDESDKSQEEQQHIWLSLRVNGPGGIQLTSIKKARFDVIWFPEDHPPGTKDPRLWTGEHPAAGPWSWDQLCNFLAEPRIRALRPVCDLHVVPNDKVGDFLKSLDSLQGIPDCPVIVSLLAGE